MYRSSGFGKGVELRSNLETIMPDMKGINVIHTNPNLFINLIISING